MYASTCMGRNFACCGGFDIAICALLKFSYRIIVKFLIFGKEGKRRGGRGEERCINFAFCFLC